jgi:hypothetical protein
MQPPSFPGPANQNLKWMSSPEFLINQCRCLSSEMLAGTLRKVHSPGIHLLGVSAITHLFVCRFFQIMVPQASVTEPNPSDAPVPLLVP